MTFDRSCPWAAVRRPLLAFFALTFAISWSAWLVAIGLGGEFTSSEVLPFFLIGGFGPLLAAALVRMIWKRKTSTVYVNVNQPIRGRIRLRLVAFSLGFAGPAGAALIGVLIGAPGFDSTEAKVFLAGGVGVIAQIFGMVIAGPLSEEPGWRGYALPRLRERLTPVQAAVILGPIWALWHLPLFFVTGTSQQAAGLLTGRGLLFFVGILPGTVLFNYAYEKLGGTTSAVIAHFAFNATSSILAFSSVVVSIFSVLIQAGLAAVILRRTEYVVFNTPRAALVTGADSSSRGGE